MKPIRSAFVAAALLAPASLAAQPAGTTVLPASPTTRNAVQQISLPIRVGRGGPADLFYAPVVAGTGTRLSLQPRWMGQACPGGGPGGGCLVAQG